MKIADRILPIVFLACAGLLGAGAALAQYEASPSSLAEEESRIIAEDRQALQEAIESGRSTKIMSARKQLSDDLERFGQRRRMDFDGVVVPLKPDNEGHYFVDAVINGRVHASLMVDTGAPLVMLSSGFVAKLGLDTDKLQKGYMMTLNGRHPAAQVYLRSLKLGRAEKNNVVTAVMLQENPELESKFQDGLLGLSYLQGFHYTIDHKKKRLILRKLR